jgi:hypothetical protein
MRKSPPRPSYAPAIAATLGAALLICSSASLAADRIQKLDLMIPPGHSQLDDLQKSYESTSNELQSGFELVQKNAGNCDNGTELAKLVAKGVPWQKAQREKISKALNQSTADLQTEIASLDQTAADANALAGAGTASITSSKAIIQKGLDQPRGVLLKELPSAQAFSFRLRVYGESAAQYLTGNSPACKVARDAFLSKIKAQAAALPEKMKKLIGALDEHRGALNRYADSVNNALVKKSGRSPASQ